MAITKIFTVKNRIDHIIDYISNGEKTEDCKFASGINCAPETAAEMMRATYTLNDKPLRVEGYHIIQSFAPGEVDAEVAHAIGMQLAERLWGDRFQTVVATHLDTNVYHNHIALCSTSFIDGKRYHSCKTEYRRLRDASDAICKEYGLSIIENPGQAKHKSFAETQAERAGRPTWRTIIRADVDEAIAKAATDRQFFQNLEAFGYEIKLGKDISVRPPGKERFLRLERNFGKDYSRDAIIRRILRHSPHVLPVRRPQATDPRPKKLPPVPKGSLAALIRRYRYLFGCYRKIPTDKQNARVRYLLREDLEELHNIDEDARFLDRTGIETIGQLDAFRHRVERAIEELTAKRQPLYRIARNASDLNAAEDTKTKIAAINEQLKLYRKQVKQCDRIAERSSTLAGRVAHIEAAYAASDHERNPTTRVSSR